MGREIKFRLWARQTNRMCGPYTLDEMQKHCSFPLHWADLMQFTGLTDKNGTEIYEGDVVQFTAWWFDGNHAESNLTGEIVYDNYSMSFQLKGVKNTEWERYTGHENDSDYLTPFSELRFEEEDFEVIGNIYANPELIREAENDRT